MAAEEEKKPADVKPSQAVITLKVKDQVRRGAPKRCACASTRFTASWAPQGGQETIFKVKRHTKMKKVFAAYASRKGIRVESLRFVLDGDRISPDQTPESVRRVVYGWAALRRFSRDVTVVQPSVMMVVCSWNWRTRTRSMLCCSRKVAPRVHSDVDPTGVVRALLLCVCLRVEAAQRRCHACWYQTRRGVRNCSLGVRTALCPIRATFHTIESGSGSGVHPVGFAFSQGKSSQPLPLCRVRSHAQYTACTSTAHSTAM